MRVSAVLIGLCLSAIASSAVSQSFDDMLRSIFEVSPRVESVASKPARELEYLWLVIASRDNAQEAIQIANGFSPIIGDVSVLQSSNGRYAVVAGFLSTSKAKANAQAMKAIRLIPEDSFLTVGEKFHQLVWSSGPDF